MHFRHFLILSLMVGAAMFLPYHAFAEKNGLSQKASIKAVTLVKTNNTAKQTNIPAKAKNAKSLEKTLVVPKPAVTKKDVVKQQASNNKHSRKLATASKNLPAQAKGNVQSAIKKTEKDVLAPEPEKAAVVLESKSGLEKNKPTSKNTALQTLHQNDSQVENRAQSARVVKNFEAHGESTHLSISKRENGFKPLVPKQQKKGKVPTSKEEIPTVNQVMNPTQRTNSSGGQSNDRVNSGLSTISLIDKWFEWNKHFEVKLIRSYLSRHILMNNQWVNAPPSPPPQEAPLLKTVYRS